MKSPKKPLFHWQFILMFMVLVKMCNWRKRDDALPTFLSFRPSLIGFDNLRNMSLWNEIISLFNIFISIIKLNVPEHVWVLRWPNVCCDTCNVFCFYFLQSTCRLCASAWSDLCLYLHRFLWISVEVDELLTLCVGRFLHSNYAQIRTVRMVWRFVCMADGAPEGWLHMIVHPSIKHVY